MAVVTVAAYAAEATVLEHAWTRSAWGGGRCGPAGPGVSAAAGAALATLHRRLSGVILVPIVQNKEETFFFFPFSLWGDIIVHKPHHAEYGWIYDHGTFLK